MRPRSARERLKPSRNPLSEASAGCVVKPEELSRMEPVNLELYNNSGWLVLADGKMVLIVSSVRVQGA